MKSNRWIGLMGLLLLLSGCGSDSVVSGREADSGNDGQTAADTLPTGSGGTSVDLGNTDRGTGGTTAGQPGTGGQVGSGGAKGGSGGAAGIGGAGGSNGLTKCTIKCTWGGTHGGVANCAAFDDSGHPCLAVPCPQTQAACEAIADGTTDAGTGRTGGSGGAPGTDGTDGGSVSGDADDSGGQSNEPDK